MNGHHGREEQPAATRKLQNPERQTWAACVVEDLVEFASLEWRRGEQVSRRAGWRTGEPAGRVANK